MLAPVPRRLRAADWLAMTVLAASFALALAASVGDGLRTGNGWLPIQVIPAHGADGYPRVAPGRRSVASEIEVGDEVQAVAGQDLRGRTALFFYDRAHAAARAEGSVALRLARGGQPFEVRLGLIPLPFWWLPKLFSVALLGTALAIWILAPGWHLAARYALACWCFAMITGTSLGPGPTSIAKGWMMLVLSPIGAGLTVWNGAELTLSARPVPLALRALALGTAALAVVVNLMFYLLPTRPGAPLRIQALYGITFAVATLAGITRGYLRSIPVERRQLRWVLLGFYVAMLGFAVFAVVPGPSTAIVSSIAGLAIPIAMTIAVVGYRFLDVDPLISAVASYSVVGLGVLGGALALVPRAAGALAGATGLEPSASQWLLTMGLIGAAIPVHRALRPRIDQRLFAARHERMRGFEALLDEIGRCASVEDLTRLPGERLDALLEPESIATYAREETAFTPVFVRGRGVPPVFDAHSPLVTTLERRVRPLAADAAELDAFERAALETLGVSVVVPTRRRDVLVAFTCLGRKLSGDIYTPEEIAYLTAVANRCAEVLVTLDDEVVLREARALQHSLRRYVPGAVAEELARGRELAAEEREVTVLFVDLRGYTSLAERRVAEEIFSTLNEYTETVSSLLRARGGAIVEFHGDGLLAVFGAPQPLEAKERAAVEAARDVLGALAGRLAVGIGVATGTAFVGNLRAADRLIWTAIGNTTNLAARLQALTRELDAAIAIDAATESRAGYVCADFEHHPAMAIRGRSERQDVWTLALDRVRPRGGADAGAVGIS
jgi:class 3 adenylate cyclase